MDAHGSRRVAGTPSFDDAGDARERVEPDGELGRLEADDELRAPVEALVGEEKHPLGDRSSVRSPTRRQVSIRRTVQPRRVARRISPRRLGGGPLHAARRSEGVSMRSERASGARDPRNGDGMVEDRASMSMSTMVSGSPSAGPSCRQLGSALACRALGPRAWGAAGFKLAMVAAVLLGYGRHVSAVEPRGTLPRWDGLRRHASASTGGKTTWSSWTTTGVEHDHSPYVPVDGLSVRAKTAPGRRASRVHLAAAGGRRLRQRRQAPLQ